MSRGKKTIYISTGDEYEIDMSRRGFCGKGGNGEVRLLRSTKDGTATNLVIKSFSPSNVDESKRLIRYKRFKREIEEVRKLQTEIQGLLPVIDFSCPNYELLTKQDAWYIMPRAERFHISDRKSLEDKLITMINLGSILLQIHKRNKSHRDIKPSNILMYNGQVCLSDFGLVWTHNSEDLTKTGEKVGPSFILPPELAHIPHNANINYQKSDTYLFSKVVWMYIAENEDGFWGQYNRNIESIVLKKSKYNVPSLEPLHRMFEEATQDDYDKRMDLQACLSYIDMQIKICRNELSTHELAILIADETKHQISSKYEPEQQVFGNIEAIISVLKELLPYVSITVINHGQERSFHATNITTSGNEIVLLEVINHTSIKYRLRPKSLVCGRDSSFQIELNHFENYPANGQSLFDPGAFPSSEYDYILDEGTIVFAF